MAPPHGTLVGNHCSRGTIYIFKPLFANDSCLQIKLLKLLKLFDYFQKIDATFQKLMLLLCFLE